MGIILDFINRNDKSYHMDEKVKNGKMSYDEALNILAKDFAEAAYMFWKLTLDIKNEVDRYNEWIPNVEETILSLCNSSSKQESLDKLYIEQHKAILTDITETYNNRNEMFLYFGYFAMYGVKHISEVAGVDTSSRFSFLSRCLKPEIKEYVLTKHPIKSNVNYEYPTAEMFNIFGQYIDIYESSVQDNKATCFNKFGQIINKDGVIVEADLISELKSVDYKGF
jgi:hypothetical protein